MGLVFLIYIAGIAGSVSKVFGVIGFIGAVASIAVSLTRHGFWLEHHNEKIEKKPDHTFWRKILIASVCALFISAIIPDKKTTYWMAGAYVGSQIVQSETAGKVVDMINVQIDKYIKEMQQEETPAKNEKKESK